jgi:hypothetical protein
MCEQFFFWQGVDWDGAQVRVWVASGAKGREMAKRWIDEVRQRKQLALFAPEPGVWRDALRRAIITFNLFSVARDLGVILTSSQSAPNPNGPGADVQFTTLTGTALEGHTNWSRRSGDPPNQIAAAFISMPATPQGRTEGRPARVIGDEVKVLMVVHEFIHACGLEDSEHTSASDPDVFSTGWIPDVGQRPEDDGVHLGQTKVPPLVFHVRTAQLIRNNWR